MIHIKRTIAGPLLAAALLSADAAAQDRVVRLPERDRPLAGTPAQVFSIGRAEGAEHEMFGIVAGVAFDAGDNLYVLDRQNPRVLVYDRTGRFVRQIGRRGQGPGELIVPVALVVAGDGTIVIQDMGRPAYSLFRPDGTFIRNVGIEGWLPMISTPLAWHPRGGVVGTFRQALSEATRMGSTTRTDPTIPLMFHPITGGGEPVRLYDVPQQWTVQQSSEPADGGQGQRVNMRISGPPAFSPPVLFGVVGNGQMALSFTPGYTVRILNAEGQTVRYIQRPTRTRLTTQADRDRAREERRALMASGRGGIVITRGGGGGAPPPPPNQRQMQERELANMQFADTIPALQGLRVAPSGKLWIERTGAIVGESGPIDLVTPEGQYLGTITTSALPDAISRSGLAAYIERDENDVERVIVRRLPEGWR